MRGDLGAVSPVLECRHLSCPILHLQDGPLWLFGYRIDGNESDDVLSS